MKLFGTDGVRGVAGEWPLDETTILRLGAALVRVLPHQGPARLLTGRDTRESGFWIERTLARGIRAMGGDLLSAGVVPTPAVAVITRAQDFDAGIVISASHNPYQDNGIKVFSGHGQKFDEGLERQIEALVADPHFVVSADASADIEYHEVVEPYMQHCEQALPLSGALSNLRIALDCANGATTTVAPRLFRALGLDVHVIGNDPDGRNINLHCGSTHLEALQAYVREHGLDLGIAFDGDGDRCLMIDDQGQVIDGDAIMLILALHLQRTGGLAKDTVVATVMSNLGLERALESNGIRLLRTAVGDKYVMEEIREHGYALGGEQSGHVIVAEHLFTGDGIVTALSVLRVMAETGRSVRDLASALVTYPQVLVNVRVGRRVPVAEVPAIAAAIDAVERRLGQEGRLLVRYSGTEPLLRIMLEGRDQAEIEAWAHEIADAAKGALGAG
ncbi:phosphoglucosamine mutase [Luteitalea sp. TBR-22]|uniref:phosphoglucosamine mutase n=1 Tax=Luteitalea sp. TBR-22 TaxID=2802971 RepID=UPI001AF9E91B|nr:phosphoglucosamine mutase [Luteitalea sp. TBR-22]BCS31476.1 phosphoglucosamine mutase [Luteitalea sp. TBR-22]